MSKKKNTNISYSIEEVDNDENNERDINEYVNHFLGELDDEKTDNDVVTSNAVNYSENYTVKELLLICDYYGFGKNLKLHKLNKREIIECLNNFENDMENMEIVFKRQNMWFYINELKNDKFMKKYVLW